MFKKEIVNFDMVKTRGDQNCLNSKQTKTTFPSSINLMTYISMIYDW